MFGRTPRTKTAVQMLEEVQTLYDLGWRRQIFVVDDNFVGNQTEAKTFLRELIRWMEDHSRPVDFFTHASVTLAKSPELLDLMLRAGFVKVLMGIETTDIDNLRAAGKFQNVAVDLDEACRTINGAGFQVVCLMMIGFDGEKRGRDQSIIEFAKRNNVNEVSVSLLQALPGTALWNRLEMEGRVLPIDEDKIGDIFNLSMNFTPSRPVTEIYGEFVNVYTELYRPGSYLERTYKHFENMKPVPFKSPFRFPYLYEVSAFLGILLKEGILGSARWEFMKLVWKGLRKFPMQRFSMFVRSCVMLAHYDDLGKEIADQLRSRGSSY